MRTEARTHRASTVLPTRCTNQLPPTSQALTCTTCAGSREPWTTSGTLPFPEAVARSPSAMVRAGRESSSPDGRAALPATMGTLSSTAGCSCGCTPKMNASVVPRPPALSYPRGAPPPRLDNGGPSSAGYGLAKVRVSPNALGGLSTGRGVLVERVYSAANVKPRAGPVGIHAARVQGQGRQWGRCRPPADDPFGSIRTDLDPLG
jgi:hypothetical protein